jgi:hypothetical protein
MPSDVQATGNLSHLSLSFSSTIRSILLSYGGFCCSIWVWMTGTGAWSCLGRSMIPCLLTGRACGLGCRSGHLFCILLPAHFFVVAYPVLLRAFFLHPTHAHPAQHPIPPLIPIIHSILPPPSLHLFQTNLNPPFTYP